MLTGAVVGRQENQPLGLHYLGGSLITWKSKKQATMAKFSTEEEYKTLVAVTSELMWITHLLTPFEVKVPSTMVLYGNKFSIQFAKNPTTHERLKHIDIDCHFIREHVQSGFLNLIHVNSRQQLTNILTKALPKV